MNKARWVVLAALAALLLIPFVLRWKNPAEPAAAVPADCDRLVIVTAHNKAVCDEYEYAFRRYYRENFHRDIKIEFLCPGGTSDIVRFISDRFEAEFRHHWENRHRLWKPAYAGCFCDPKYDAVAADSEAGQLRREFLNSEIGIGIDVFAGGGTFEQQRMAAKGYAVPGGVERRHPEYFRHIPAVFGGETVYDRDGRYYGVVLSTFGIACNTDRLSELADPRRPETWRDLADPRFFNCLAVADPSKSGSANKCFEIVIQQAMSECGSPAEGWQEGLSIIRRIIGNARTISDSASRVVRDISCGDAAAAMAIDNCALSEAAFQRERCGGRSHLIYITPRGGTAISPDPVQILRGAPNRQAAERFLDFLLSKPGQRLHAYRPGIADGPQKYHLNRPPVRQDMYLPEETANFSLPDYDPYVSGADFSYRAELTGPYYSLLRQYIKCTMLDVQIELRRAWQAIIASGGPEAVPQAMRYFDALKFSYSEAAAVASELRQTDSPVKLAEIYRSWSDFARCQYAAAEAACKLAGAGGNK